MEENFEQSQWDKAETKPQKRQWLFWIVAFFLLYTFFNQFFSSGFGSAHLKAGTPAPVFSLLRLNGVGKQSLEDFKGKVVVLNFFATWCSSCRQQMPDLIRLHNQAGLDNLVVVGISGDSSLTEIRDYLGQKKINFPVFLGNDKAFKDFGVKVLPTTYLINGSGVIKGGVQGQIGYDNLLAEIGKLE